MVRDADGQKRPVNGIQNTPDESPSTAIPGEITDQGNFDPDNLNTNNNYAYDEMGNLIKDLSAEIAEITWTVAGKVKNIIRSSGSDYKNLTFDYDAMGNRVAKHIFNNDQTWVSSTFYIRDAQVRQFLGFGAFQNLRTDNPASGGRNIMATYSKRILDETMSFKRMEAMVYGSSRAGVCIDSLEMIEAVVPEEYFNHRMRFKQYELSNHLGNVLTVVTDCKIPRGDEYVYYYLPDVVSSTDYYPFGQQMPGRSFSGEQYKFGFNGKENDNEVYGEGNFQDYGMRMYDSRVGRFISIDPITKDYPELTPFQFASNTPICGVDIDGLEVFYAADGSVIARIGDNTQVRLVDDKDIEDVKGYANWANHGSAQYRERAINGALSLSCDVGMNEDELNTRAFLTLIRQTEAHGNEVTPYNRKFGGGFFTDTKNADEWGSYSDDEGYSDHPGPTENTPAGAYQIKKKTFDWKKNAAGVSDFSPQSQDKVALELIDYRGATEYVKSGNVNMAIPLLLKEWTSLPGAKEQGSGIDMNYAEKQFKTNIANELKGASDIATPQGSLKLN